MKKMTRYIVAGLIGLTVFSIGTLVVLHMIRIDPTKARLVQAAMPVRVAMARVETLNEIIGASGVVRPFSFVNLTANVSREVEKVYVDVGDVVSIGQNLVQFDTTLFKETLTSVHDDVAMAKTALENDRLRLKRVIALYDEELIAKAKVEEVQLMLDTSKARYSTAIRELVGAQNRIKNATVKASIAGVIMERFVNPGETPQTGDPLFTLARLDTVFMTANVPEEKLTSVEIGQTAEVVFDAIRQETMVGMVTKIEPKVNPTIKAFRTYIKLENSKLQLMFGLSGFVRIKNQRTTLAVPSVAIINPVGDQATVFVVGKDLTVHLKPVKIGLVTNEMTEVISGLREGEQVVTVGQRDLKENDKVRIGKEEQI